MWVVRGDVIEAVHRQFQAKVIESSKFKGFDIL
jgi:hypothetical protein